MTTPTASIELAERIIESGEAGYALRKTDAYIELPGFGVVTLPDIGKKLKQESPGVFVWMNEHKAKGRAHQKEWRRRQKAKT